MSTIHRRAILQSTGLLTAGLLASQITPMFAAPAGKGEAGTELLRDPSFRRGFVLLRAEPGRKVECGTVRGPSADAPVWQLAQWSSRHPFDGTTAVTHGDGGSLRLANPARTVGFGGDEGILTLAVNTAAEYADRPRAGSEPWVHLLVEQSVATPPQLADLTALRLRLEARRGRARLALEGGYAPRIHAAHFQIFITLPNP